MIRLYKKAMFTFLGGGLNPDDLYQKLQGASIPTSYADCRTCPHPCDQGSAVFLKFMFQSCSQEHAGHESYPDKFDADMKSDLLGTVKPYCRQVRIHVFHLHLLYLSFLDR